jgi:RimJ/RimL family protein N-acetyltransferase
MDLSRNDVGPMDALSSISTHVRRKGFRSAAVGAFWTVVSPIVRQNRRVIWERKLNSTPASAEWKHGQRLIIIGRDNIAEAGVPALLRALAAGGAGAEIDGVHRGNRLFVVADGAEYVTYSFVFFESTKETRRHSCIYGERVGIPIIGMSYTLPTARGRGLYRRILSEMFRVLAAMGYDRAICEVHPDNIASNKASEAAGMTVCRQITDIAFFNWFFVQRVREHNVTRWRAFFV